MTDTVTLKIVRTRTGRPAMWDEGGKLGEVGRAVVVAGQFGEPLRPLYRLWEGEGARPASRHALMPLDVGCHVIHVHADTSDLRVVAMRITDIPQEGLVCEARLMYTGGWPAPGALLYDAIDAATSMAEEPGCLEPGYAADMLPGAPTCG